MFPAQTPQTIPNELFRCGDSSNLLMAEEQLENNGNTQADETLAKENLGF